MGSKLNLTVDDLSVDEGSARPRICIESRSPCLPIWTLLTQKPWLGDLMTRLWLTNGYFGDLGALSCA